MEKSGIVSVWIGNVDSEKTLSQLTEYRITREGEFVACPFCRVLGIESYDPEKLEWKFFPKQIERIRILFHAFSYSHTVIPQLEQLVDRADANCCIALYDIQFDGNQMTIAIGDTLFRFLGCTTYREG